MGALRFLGLVEGQHNDTTQRLHTLVAATSSPDAFAAEMAATVLAAYKNVIGDLDVSKASVGQLENAFKDATSLEGSMLERVIRFYLKALKDAKFPISPFLLKRKARAMVRPRGNGKGGHRSVEEPEGIVNSANGTTTELTPPAGTISYPLYFKDKPVGTIIVPKDLEADDVAVIDLTVAILRPYAEQRGGKSTN